MEFTFQPAPLAARVTYRLDDVQLICLNADGKEMWRLELDSITELAYVAYKSRDASIRRIDIADAHAVAKSVSYTASRSGSPKNDYEAAYDGLLGAIAGHLAVRKPDMPVKLGEHGTTRWIMFGFGVLALAVAAIIAVFVIADGGKRMLAVAAPVILLSVFGLVLVAGNAPWSKPREVPVSKLAQRLSPARRE